MDVLKCCMINGWTYLGSSSFILFASNLEWLVTKIPEGIFLQIYFYAHFTKASQQKGESSCYLPKVLVLGQKLVLGKPSNYVSNWWSGFPSNTNLCVPISRFMSTRLVVFMINICIYNHLFKVFINRENEGVENLVCGNVRETNWFKRFLMWAWIWWCVNEVASMLADVVFLFKLHGWFFMNVYRSQHCLHHSMPMTFIGHFIVQDFPWIDASQVNLV